MGARQLLDRFVQWLRGGLVFKAHRLLYRLERSDDKEEEQRVVKTKRRVVQKEKTTGLREV